MSQSSEEAISQYFEDLKISAGERYGIRPEHCHLGHILLHSMLERPDLVHQIDAATGESRTNADVAAKSVALARSLKTLGLQRGDVICVTGPNYLDLCLPIYAGPLCGYRVMTVDGTFQTSEFKQMFAIGQPKLVFCSTMEKCYVNNALDELNQNAQIITFDQSDMDINTFIMKYGEPTTAAKEFRPDDFDLDTDCYLLSTSGSTGTPKLVPLTHDTLLNFTAPFIWLLSGLMPKEGEKDLMLSLCQWLSSMYSYLNTPIMGLTRIQTSKVFDEAHVAYILKTYKPNYGTFAPPRLTQLLNYPDCDFSSFNMLLVSGSAITKELLKKLTSRSQCTVIAGYGLTETAGAALGVQLDLPPLSSGRPLKALTTRLVNPESGVDIIEFNKTGELWLKGQYIFKGYYNMPEETIKSFSEDGWLKTGDLFYKDENENYVFVDRLKLLIKYKNYQISPTELEALISSLPGVAEVGVTGVPSEEDGELVVAIVVRDAEHNPPVTADDIKSCVVKERLQVSKQIRGGVFFIDSLPLNVNGKVDRAKLKEIAKNKIKK